MNLLTLSLTLSDDMSGKLKFAIDDWWIYKLLGTYTLEGELTVVEYERIYGCSGF